MREHKNNNQVVGNIGLFYVCYRLSRLAWNVMPTARNARGIDILIYSQDAKTTKTLQIKTLSKRNPVPLGRNLDLLGDFLVVCRNVNQEQPECFILTPEEACEGARGGVKNGKASHWLQLKGYEQDRFKEGWDRIGRGDTKSKDSTTA